MFCCLNILIAAILSTITSSRAHHVVATLRGNSILSSSPLSTVSPAPPRFLLLPAAAAAAAAVAITSPLTASLCYCLFTNSVRRGFARTSVATGAVANVVVSVGSISGLPQAHTHDVCSKHSVCMKHTIGRPLVFSSSSLLLFLLSSHPTYFIKPRDQEQTKGHLVAKFLITDSFSFMYSNADAYRDRTISERSVCFSICLMFY